MAVLPPSYTGQRSRASSQQTHHLIIPVDLRTRMEPRIPDNYLGNCVGRCFASAQKKEHIAIGVDGLIAACSAVAAGIDEGTRYDREYWNRSGECSKQEKNLVRMPHRLWNEECPPMQATLCYLNLMVHIIVVVPSSSICSGAPSGGSGPSYGVLTAVAVAPPATPCSSGPSDGVLAAVVAPPVTNGSDEPFDGILAVAAAAPPATLGSGGSPSGNPWQRWPLRWRPDGFSGSPSGDPWQDLSMAP
ncbi:hypothetical protein ABZP36_024332 [Zizania latifolia]